MMNNKKHIFFVGVGGIGMSALARYFNAKNFDVAGYDRERTALINQLEEEGIWVTAKDEVKEIPTDFQNAKETLVVYTPAIRSDNQIFSHFKSKGFECIKRAELLGRISKNIPTIAVAGTHGKTTVSTMIAYVLHHAGLKVNAFLGGISRNFNSNLLLDEAANLVIIEADEYDRSFLQLHPKTAVITSLSVDHLDSYSDEQDLFDAYNKFSSQIQNEGLLFAHQSVVKDLSEKTNYQLKTYGKGDADISISNLHLEKGDFYFDIDYNGVKTKEICSGMPGLHNVENAAVAFGLALEYGVKADLIKAALANFLGVQRRFDVHIKREDFVYIDDYAHHPEAIDVLIRSVREMYPKRKITAVFQPHLYSRTRDFADEFAAALSLADQLILMELYPAREEPIAGVNSKWLAGKIDNNKVQVIQDEEFLKHLQNTEIDILLTIGAGNIREMVPKIIKQFK